MRKILSVLLLALLPAAARAENADSVWLASHYTKKEVYIPMRDGVKLFTAIYAPRDGEKHPVLLNRTPYSIAPYGDKFKPFWNTPYLAYFKKGYIMVLQDVRGKYMSEGDFVDVRPYVPAGEKYKSKPDEATDSYDAIDWIVKNVKDNNGKVGIWGISYPGFYATEAALSGHQALVAASPQAPVTEWFLGDDFHHNGALMLMDAFSFYSGFGKPRHGVTKVSEPGFQHFTPDNYDFYLSYPTLADLSHELGDSIKFWNDLCKHPDYDDWWKARNARKYVQDIPAHTATLVVGGLFDAEDCFGAWNLYKAIEKKADNNNKLVMGPWSHGGWVRTKGEFLGNVRFGKKNSEWYQQHVEQPFFDHYLLGKGDARDIKEATIFFSGANQWRTFSQWPPQTATDKRLYFNEQGTLTTSKQPDIASNHFSKYTSNPNKPVPYTEDVHMRRTAEYMTDDQRFAARRPDVLVYKTDTLTSDMTLAGPVIADLFTAISTTDADFVVKLIDVFPDNFVYDTATDGSGNGKDYPMGGYEMLVRGEIMRGRYRNSFSKPEAFTPGRITEVKFSLPDVAHVFKKGHRIMVQVQSSWFPLADRNPQQFVNIYTARKEDFVNCDVKIMCGGEGGASSIILPVIEN